MASSGRWFQRSISSYTEELEKSFTKAKQRVQRGFEQLKLKNSETLRRIPSFRGNKKPQKDKSPKLMPSSSKTAELARSSTMSRHDLNATYCISRKPFIKDSYADYSSDSDDEQSTLRCKTSKLESTFNASNSFPRISRSRKIENINIVLSTAPRSPISSFRKQRNTSPEEQVIEEASVVFSKDDMPPRLIYRKKKINATGDAIYLKQTIDGEEYWSTDSELANSTDISFRSYDSQDADEDGYSLYPTLRVNSDEEVNNPDTNWVSTRIIRLPRTSSRLSMESRRRASPDLSPIAPRDGANKSSWGMTYRVRKDKRPLSRINETVRVDSGYSDRSEANSSRAILADMQQNRWATPSPVSAIDDERSGLKDPYSVKSIYV